MKISVITPIYEGNKYIQQLVSNVEQAAKKVNLMDIELILVNDSPWQKIIVELKSISTINVKILENTYNVGIHLSRINGLRKSEGDYVLFLDQDDNISLDYFESQVKNLNGAEMVVCNGFCEELNKTRLLYRKKKTQNFLMRQFTFLNLHNPIISPGQCLIQKAAIPEFWYNVEMKKNGADDLFLWLLLIKNNVKIVNNYECLYTHVNTGENVSNDLSNMYDSCIEMCNYLKGIYTDKEINQIINSVKYTNILLGGNYRSIFLESVKHLDLFVLNAVFYFFFK